MTSKNPVEWWLAVNGHPTGPYSEAYLQAAIAGGTVRLDQLVAPVGGTEWKSLSMLEPFRETKAGAPPLPSSVDTTRLGKLDRILQQTIAWYLVVGEPLLLCLAAISFAVTPTRFLANSPPYAFEMTLAGTGIVFSPIVTILSWIGGLRLLMRKRDSAYWITFGLAGSWILSLGYTLLMDFLQAISDPATLNPEYVNRAQESRLGWAILAFLFTLTVLVLQVVSVIWIWLRRDQL